MTTANAAIVSLDEVATFQYPELDDTSLLETHFRISLIKNNGLWVLGGIESDLPFFYRYKETECNLQDAINGVISARETGSVEQSDSYNRENLTESDLKGSSTILERTYRKANAVNYALTYSLTNSSLSFPSIRNQNFYCANQYNCMRFVSQCIWAGLGGSNDSSSITAKHAMDNSSYGLWYGGASYGTEYVTWKSTSYFKSYVDNIRSSSENGIYCDVNNVSNSSNVLTNSTTVTTADLTGAALLVEGSGGEHSHAVILTLVNGSTRDNVYYSAYSSCAKNVKLSTNYSADASNSNAGVYEWFREN